MAYMIQKLAKAHYLCINIECGKEVLAELETGFRFNDAVLRHLTVLQDEAVTTPSVMMKMVEREDSRKSSPPDRGDRGDRGGDRGDRGDRPERQPQGASA
jgi:small subunit ribosomal protein S6